MQLTFVYYSAIAVYAANVIFFFFNDTATTEIYTLSLHDALPIFDAPAGSDQGVQEEEERTRVGLHRPRHVAQNDELRSEEHTSELQSRQYLVCRLLLEKKKKQTYKNNSMILPTKR